MSFRLKACLLAVAIAVVTVFGAWTAILIPFGRPLAEGSGDWSGLLVETLVVALPFLALALLEERSRGLWGSGLAITFLLWGYFVYEAISYAREGSSVLAHMGFDVVLFYYPFLLALILAGLSLLRKQLSESGYDDG
jgi:hypothetical protein